MIFDLDGTLADTLCDITASTNYALAKLSQPTFDAESIRLKIGSGNKNLVASCLGPGAQHLKDKIIELQYKHYAEHFCDHTEVYPGIMDVLDLLHENSFKLAVLSNKPDPFTQAVAKQLFGDNFFDIVQGQLPDVPLKPDPTSSLAIANRLEVLPREIAFVGDSAVDMQVARNAAMFAVGVTWGFRDRAELQENGSDAIIDTPAELLPLLKCNSGVMEK